MRKQNSINGWIMVLILSSGVMLTGCGSKYIRKIDTYGLSTRKHLTDESIIAKNLGVSYPVYRQETNVIGQYRRYLAKQGKTMTGDYDVWLLARREKLLPSQYLEKAIVLTPVKQ